MKYSWTAVPWGILDESEQARAPRLQNGRKHRVTTRDMPEAMIDYFTLGCEVCWDQTAVVLSVNFFQAKK